MGTTCWRLADRLERVWRVRRRFEFEFEFVEGMVEVNLGWVLRVFKEVKGI